jgi:hypothetical protein
MHNQLKYILGTALCLAGLTSAAQRPDSVAVENNILFFKDPRVDVLQKMYMYKETDLKKLIRVQVFQASSRDKVFEAKTDFIKRFPGIQTFITYQSPNFKLRAGEFESSTEAFKFLQQIKPYFPASFVIEEMTKEEKEKSKTKPKSN